MKRIAIWIPELVSLFFFFLAVDSVIKMFQCAAEAASLLCTGIMKYCLLGLFFSGLSAFSLIILASYRENIVFTDKSMSIDDVMHSCQNRKIPCLCTRKCLTFLNLTKPEAETLQRWISSHGLRIGEGDGRHSYKGIMVMDKVTVNVVPCGEPGCFALSAWYALDRPDYIGLYSDVHLSVLNRLRVGLSDAHMMHALAGRKDLRRRWSLFSEVDKKVRSSALTEEGG